MGRPRAAGDPAEPDQDRVCDLFERAVALPADERAGYLDAECDGDVGLRVEVESLIEAHHEAGGFLSEPLGVGHAPGATRAADLSHLDPKYEVLGLIAAGGMGLVYKVRHRPLDRIMAVKVIRPELEGSVNLRRRFLREARMSTRLVHPNLARIHDFSLDGAGNAVLVMEYLEGWNLRDALDHAGRLPLPLSISIAIQSLRALDYLHRQRLVHRDVSPDNFVLLRDDGGAPLVKLIDLGIAKPAESTGSLTQSGLFLGKVLYSAPEAFGPDGPGSVDARSDLYAFGVVLYQLLTGQVPIVGADHRSIISGHLLHPPRPFAETDPEGRVSPVLRGVVSRMLAKSPSDRFSDAGVPLAMLEELACRTDPVAPGWESVLAGLTPGATVVSGSFAELAPVPSVDAQVAGVKPESPRRVAVWTRASVMGAAAVVLAAVLVSLALARVLRFPPSPSDPATVLTSALPPPELEPRSANAVRPSAPVARGVLEIDAQPWGHVTMVRPLAGGADAATSDLVTPCRLELAVGDYIVRIENERFAPIEDTVTIEESATSSIGRAFAGFDVEALVARAAP